MVDCSSVRSSLTRARLKRHLGWKPSLILCLLLLVAFERSGAQPVVRQAATKGTWSARSSTGLTLGGTWTAVADVTSGAVTGTWTLVDAKGQTLRRGAWSAAKSPTGWTGAWRAAVSGSKAEYSGTWSAGIDLKGDARLGDLFEAALKTAVSGNWRAARQSGSWSIRAF